MSIPVCPLAHSIGISNGFRLPRSLRSAFDLARDNLASPSGCILRTLCARALGNIELIKPCPAPAGPLPEGRRSHVSQLNAVNEGNRGCLVDLGHWRQMRRLCLDVHRYEQLALLKHSVRFQIVQDVPNALLRDKEMVPSFGKMGRTSSAAANYDFVRGN